MLVRMWKNRNPYSLLVGMQINITIMESSMEFLKKLKTELSFDPVIPLLGMYPEKC
jgi:hypothetical protein